MTFKNIHDLSMSGLKRYVRVPIEPMSFKVLNGPALANAYITNLSVSGAFVRSDVPLPEGTLLTLEFVLPGSSTPIVAKSVVRWCELDGTTDPAQHFITRGMGLAFIDLSESHQITLGQFVENFLKGMRKKS